ncbi:amino acid adenylation domain-containing protein [Kitasatospora sp. NPDC053057]|uniref:amino acid adenylation domain-containing protein n=1 Tax=Kitasatospora sp. NPDC053057 TaxID=3364062 RepID=UPI0037C8B428
MPSDVVSEFFRAARARADASAVIDNGRPVSYAELAAEVTAWARALADDPGTGAVAVPAVHSVRTIAAALGVMAAGRAYLPVDPAFPDQRQAMMLAGAGCDTVLRTAAGTLGATDGRTVLEPPVAGGDPDWTTAPDQEAVAYILFTSGSTGAPKPVEVPHRAIGAVTASLRELFDVTPESRVLQFASLNWDTCFEEILPTLTGAATLVIDGDAHGGSFPRMLRMLEREAVTTVDLPTAYWHELVRHLEEDGGTLPPSLHTVIIGGEPVDPGRLAAWRAADTAGVRLVNTYGCTETALITHAVDLYGPRTSADIAARTGAPIGRPLPHVRQLFEPWQDGAEDGPEDSGIAELLVAGPSIAAGYRGSPELTAARFVERRIGEETVRCFRTGDLVRELPEGNLGIQGRADRQLKVRGVRLDPSEIEHELTAHPEVAASAVCGTEAAGRTILAAHIVPGTGADPASLPDRVLADLRRRLPAHLIPTRLVVVDELPYTTSGKVDYPALLRNHPS